MRRNMKFYRPYYKVVSTKKILLDKKIPTQFIAVIYFRESQINNFGNIFFRHFEPC